MSQQYAPVTLVSTPEEKEVDSFAPDAVARQGLEPAEKIDNVADTCVNKDGEEVLRSMEEHQQMYAANKDRWVSVS